MAAWVYIITNKRDGTLYIGVTSDLPQRIWQHREGVAEGFSKQYRLKHLVWFESHDEITEAIRREKALKEWPRAWKVELIEKTNPDWDDLYSQLI